MSDLQEEIAIRTLTTEKKKLVINWFSNAPWANTGYGVQTRINYPRIKALGYDLSITAFWGLQGGRQQMNDGTLVYPIFKHVLGQDVIGLHALHAGANAIITLMDAWVVQPEYMEGVDWYPWFPIDHEPMPMPVYNEVIKARKPIVMSKFGQRMAEQAGIDVYYVPHSVETKTFKPIDRDKARKRLGFPQDKFIIGMVAANQGRVPRKSFFEQITAFAAFHKKHPDSMLYLHTDDGTHGGECVDLKTFCAINHLKTGIVDCKPLPEDIDVAFVEQYQYALGIPDIYLVDVYNSLDVMMLCSMGEGFGIPLIEAQACGCPVITGAWTAMDELVFSGWKIAKEEAIQTWCPEPKAFQWRVKVEPLVDRLLKAYEVKNNLEYRDRARAGAMQYDADEVCEKYWKPVLADIEAHLDDKAVECQAPQ